MTDFPDLRPTQDSVALAAPMPAAAPALWMPNPSIARPFQPQKPGPRPDPPSGRYRPGRRPERKKPDLNGRAKRLYSRKFLWLPDLGSNQGPTD